MLQPERGPATRYEPCREPLRIDGTGMMLDPPVAVRAQGDGEPHVDQMCR
ncbi:hypothetical protein AB5J72_47160 [Streptomyces sp. CG1]